MVKNPAVNKITVHDVHSSLGGYWKLPRGLQTAILTKPLTRNETKIILVINELTLARMVASEVISLSQFESKTGIKKSRVSIVTSAMVEKKIIFRAPDKNSLRYQINVDFDSWNIKTKPQKIRENGLLRNGGVNHGGNVSLTTGVTPTVNHGGNDIVNHGGNPGVNHGGNTPSAEIGLHGGNETLTTGVTVFRNLDSYNIYIEPVDDGGGGSSNIIGKLERVKAKKHIKNLMQSELKINIKLESENLDPFLKNHSMEEIKRMIDNAAFYWETSHQRKFALRISEENFFSPKLQNTFDSREKTAAVMAKEAGGSATAVRNSNDYETQIKRFRPKGGK